MADKNIAETMQFELVQDRKGMVWDLLLYIPTVIALASISASFWYGDDHNMGYLFFFLTCFFFIAGFNRVFKTRLMLLPSAPICLKVGRAKSWLGAKKRCPGRFGEKPSLLRRLCWQVLWYFRSGWRRKAIAIRISQRSVCQCGSIRFCSGDFEAATSKSKSTLLLPRTSLNDIPCHVANDACNDQANYRDEFVLDFRTDQSAYEHMHRVAGYEQGADRDNRINQYLAYHAMYSLFLRNW